MIVRDDYELVRPIGPYGPLGEMSRPEALSHSRWLMEVKDQRVEELRRLVGREGIELANDDVSLQILNDWFIANLKADVERPDHPSNRWYSVI